MKSSEQWCSSYVFDVSIDRGEQIEKIFAPKWEKRSRVYALNERKALTKMVFDIEALKLKDKTQRILPNIVGEHCWSKWITETHEVEALLLYVERSMR